jgi:hypothetical protein
MDHETQSLAVRIWLNNPLVTDDELASRIGCTAAEIRRLISGELSPPVRAARERLRRVVVAMQGASPLTNRAFQAERQFGRIFDRGPAWNAARKAARKRDGNACRVCGISAEELGRNMSVHHRRPYGNFEIKKQANRLNNLVCLCNSCHRRAEIGSIRVP